MAGIFLSMMNLGRAGGAYCSKEAAGYTAMRYPLLRSNRNLYRGYGGSIMGTSSPNHTMWGRNCALSAALSRYYITADLVIREDLPRFSLRIFAHAVQQFS